MTIVARSSDEFFREIIESFSFFGILFWIFRWFLLNWTWMIDQNSLEMVVNLGLFYFKPIAFISILLEPNILNNQT
jgi:hypothetical protein